MSGVNKAILVGHLGADPEIRRSQSGAPIASFQVATGEGEESHSSTAQAPAPDVNDEIPF